MGKRTASSPFRSHTGTESGLSGRNKFKFKNMPLRFLTSIRKTLKKQFSREALIRFRLFRESHSPRSWYAERSADVVILSYPKCGRTWLRIMMGKSIALHFGLGDINYLANDLVADSDAKNLRVRVSHDDNPHWKEPGKLSRNKRRYRRQKVVFLVRDPRDVVVSMYFERSRREQVDVGTIGDFLDASVGSLDTIIEYYNIWAANRHQARDFLMIRYEDLKQDAAVELRRLLDFIGLSEVSDKHIAEAVEYSSFENMRKMEVSGEVSSGRLKPGDHSDEESYKTRKGIVGGYVEYLEPDQIERMERRIVERLDPFFDYAVPGGNAPDKESMQNANSVVAQESAAARS